jgi:hypothetical protein
MIEASIAGLAAGLVACGQAEEAVYQAPRLELIRPDEQAASDIALVDAAVYAERFIASRAIWDASKIVELVLTRAEPGSIGLSSIGGHLLGGNYPAGHGLYLRLAPGPNSRQVLAPIAPGLLRTISVAEYRLLAPGEEVVLHQPQPCVLALDGEREIELRPDMALRLRLNPDGPRVIDARKALQSASQAGFFIS